MLPIKPSELIPTALFTFSDFRTGVLLQYFCRLAMALNNLICNLSMVFRDLLFLYIELRQYAKIDLTTAFEI